MLKCINIRKSFKEKIVIADLSFNLEKGEVFALLGSNGAGKTTAIKIILGLIKADSGVIKIEENIKIGYSPETPYFYPFLTGKETIRHYAKLQKIDKNQIDKEIEKVLKIVGLEDDQDIKASNYSKGMAQKLALAQALLGDPDLLILDEPTAGLDAFARINMISTINLLKEEGKTIILNSHILNDVEKVADRGIILSKGEIVKNLDKDDFIDNRLEEHFLDVIGGGDSENNTVQQSQREDTK